MKHLICIYMALMALPSFSQKSTNPAKAIAAGDSVKFVIHMAGCFHSYSSTYTFVKQKNNERLVLYKKDSTMVSQRISAKSYDEFIAKYESSYEHFSKQKDGKKCTSVSKYELSNKGKNLTFANGTCEAAFDPERTIRALLKK